MKTVKNISKVDAQLLADYILFRYGAMSHLKLQKLLFYCDAYHLAYFDGESLIPQDFEAWIHGPVCREVYNNLKEKSLLYADLGFDNSYDPAKKISASLNSTQQELIADVLNELTQWTGFELENSTHNELPWVEARKGYGSADRCEVKISKETMTSFYKSELS